jgi:hypothetical protein
MATLATFRTTVAAILGLDNQTTGDQGLIDGWVQEGYQDVLLRTGCYVIADNTLLTAGTENYTISQSILKTVGLTLTSGSNLYELERRTVNEILEFRRGSSSQGVPWVYAVAGGNLLMLYPTPASSTDSIRIYYVPAPTALTAPDTPTLVPPEWHKLIEWYALWRGADYDDDGSSNQGERYKTQYLDGIKEFRRVIRQKGGSRLAPARLRNRRQARVYSDPSRTYW